MISSHILTELHQDVYKRQGMDRMDERSEYEEIIKENLDYDILCQDPKFDKDRFREIMDIMLDADVYKRQV